MKNNYTYSANITNIVDGDTIDATVDLGFCLYAHMRFRLNGIDTYETNSSDPVKKALGLQGKQYISDRILNKEVVLKTYKQDKYGRYLCDVYLLDTNINLEMIEKGLAVGYTGGTKTI